MRPQDSVSSGCGFYEYHYHVMNNNYLASPTPHLLLAVNTYKLTPFSAFQLWPNAWRVGDPSLPGLRMRLRVRLLSCRVLGARLSQTPDPALPHLGYLFLRTLVIKLSENALAEG